MWNIIWWLIVLVYVPASVGLIVVVLLQKGKGVGFAGAFGAGGGSDTVFGPRSSKSLPQKLTYTAAGLFMFLALVLSLLTDKVNRGDAPDLVEDTSITAASTISEALTGELNGETGESPDGEGAAGAATVETPDAEGTTEVTVEEVTPEEVTPEEAAPEAMPEGDESVEAGSAEETPAP